ncbi:hypothetical protein BDZ89DRAFT_1146740 [Hymenopellis radicata]|nr:hypothetical protein BDZ89DRAFT_1146740 [Hymenopellis radicata]
MSNDGATPPYFFLTMADNGATPPSNGGATPPSNNGATPENPNPDGPTPPSNNGATPPSNNGATPENPNPDGLTPPSNNGATPENPNPDGLTPPANNGATATTKKQYVPIPKAQRLTQRGWADGYRQSFMAGYIERFRACEGDPENEDAVLEDLYRQYFTKIHWSIPDEKSRPFRLTTGAEMSRCHATS